MLSKLQTTAAMAGNDTFWQKSITRKTLITQPKHMIFWLWKILKASDLDYLRTTGFQIKFLILIEFPP